MTAAVLLCFPFSVLPLPQNLVDAFGRHCLLGVAAADDTEDLSLVDLYNQPLHTSD